MGGSSGGTPDFGGRSTTGARGSGGGGGGGSVRGGQKVNNCESLEGQTIISSPVAAAIKGVAKGDVLDLALSKGKKPPVLAKQADGTQIGTVMPTFLVQLVDCMKAGNEYQATVVKKSGGAVTVDIERKK